MNKIINKILKKTISLGLCMVFTSSLMCTANASKSSAGDEIAFTKISVLLYKADEELLNVAIDNAKKTVCENLEISRELLDEVTKSVGFISTFDEVTDYKAIGNVIRVATRDLILDENLSETNRNTNLVSEITLAFLFNYSVFDSLVYIPEGLSETKKIEKIKEVTSHCDENIISRLFNMTIYVKDKYLDGKLNELNYRYERCKHLKSLVKKWLEDGKITPIEALDRIKDDESAKKLLIELIKLEDSKKG